VTTFDNLRPTGSYEHDGEWQAEPANLDAVVDAIAGRQHTVTVDDRAPDSTRPRGVSLPGRIDGELIELWTSPIGYAHDATDYTTEVVAPLYSRLRDLRDQLEDAEADFYAATAKGHAAAETAKRAAKAAILAGEPTPVVDVVDVPALQASAAARYGALVELIREARGRYTTACLSVAPAARAALAAELPAQIAAARAAFSEFETANAQRWATVQALIELNHLVDPEYRDIESSGDGRRDRRNGGGIPIDGNDLRQLDDSFASAADAVKVVAAAIGSNDPLRTGAYVADDLGAGTFPIWFRKYVRRVDPSWLAGIEREFGVVDLDAVQSVADVAVDRKRTRVRGK
jgi:hypothetical protein